MTTLITKAIVEAIPDFAGTVARHAKELAAHDEHMALVEVAREANSKIPAILEEENALTAQAAAEPNADKQAELTRQVAFKRNKRLELQAVASSAQEYPAPRGVHPAIDAAVKRIPGADGRTQFVVDYEVVDAIPVPAGDAAALRARKNALLQEISVLETAALEKAWPPGHRRLHQMLRGTIATADHERRKKALGDKENPTKTDVDKADKAVVSGRSKDDQKFVVEYDARQALVAKIQLHAAQQMAGVEDLTAENAHLWKPEAFPTE